MFGYFRWGSVHSRKVVIRSPHAAPEWTKRIEAARKRDAKRWLYDVSVPRFDWRVRPDRVQVQDNWATFVVFGGAIGPYLDVRATRSQPDEEAAETVFVGFVGRPGWVAVVFWAEWVGAMIGIPALLAYSVFEPSAGATERLLRSAAVIAFGLVFIRVTGHLARPEPTSFGRSQVDLVREFCDVVEGADETAPSSGR